MSEEEQQVRKKAKPAKKLIRELKDMQASFRRSVIELSITAIQWAMWYMLAQTILTTFESLFPQIGNVGSSWGATLVFWMIGMFVTWLLFRWKKKYE
jgi:hypothetical protein